MNNSGSSGKGYDYYIDYYVACNVSIVNNGSLLQFSQPSKITVQLRRHDRDFQDGQGGDRNVDPTLASVSIPYRGNAFSITMQHNESGTIGSSCVQSVVDEVYRNFSTYEMIAKASFPRYEEGTSIYICKNGLTQYGTASAHGYQIR